MRDVAMKFATIALVVLIFLSLCGSAYAVSLQLSVDPVQQTAGEDVLVLATLLEDNLTPINNSIINFSADMGILSSPSNITNSSGVAFVWLNSTQSGLFNVSADHNGTINNTTVTYLPATLSSINLDVSASSLVVGNSSIVNITAYDIFNNVNTTADFSVNMTIFDVEGNLRETSTIFSTSPGNQLTVNISKDVVSNTTQVTGDSFATLDIYSNYSCSIILNVSSDVVLNSTVIEYSPGNPHSLSVTYDDEHTVNTTSTIWATVYDIYGNPVEGSTVNFEATSPENTSYNSPNTYNSADVIPASNATNVIGQAYTVFRTDKRAGDNTVNVSVFGTGLKSSFEVNGLADHPQSVLMSYTPSSCYANNEDYYRLTAQPADQFLNPILPDSGPIDEQIYFTGLGSGSTIIPLNQFGTATTKVGPTPYIENVSVTATYKNETGLTGINSSKELSFISGGVSSLQMYIYPSKVLTQNNTGNHNATIVAAALDEWGHMLPDIVLTLNNTNTSLGTLYVGNQSGSILNATTDSSGRISATFESKTEEGICNITVFNSSINTTANVTTDHGPFITAWVTANPTSITSGDIVNVTTVISVEGELPTVRDSATAMLVLDRSGSMDPDSYAGTPLDVVLVIDRSGSMNDLGSSPEQPLADALTAAKTFLDNLVSNSQVGVVTFSSSSTKALDLTLLNSSDNRDLIKYVIDDNEADGGTALGDALADANDILIDESRSSANKVVVLLTDGVATAGSDTDGSNAVDVANANDITIYAIGLGDPDYLDEPTLQRIASETGGTYYNAPTSSELEDVYNSIAQEISDYDVTATEYGEEGFTPYGYDAQGSALATNESNGPYWLVFDAWDMDNIGECNFRVNGNSAVNIGFSGDYRWRTFKHNITSWVSSGSNTVVFYDPSNYPNSIRNVRITGNGALIASYPDEVSPTSATPYTVNFDTSYYYYEEELFINNSLNDLKIQLDWTNASQDLALSLISPDGETYGIGADTTGYYPNSSNDDISEYIWLMPLSYVYPDDDTEVVETGNWTIRVSSPESSDSFNITSYIDKKSATRIASSAFLTSFDETKGDDAGLVLYSEDSLNSTINQSAYLRNESQWVGYFTVDSRANYAFDLTWNDGSGMDLKLYEGINVLNSTSGSLSPLSISSVLDSNTDYRLVIEKTSGDINDSAFSINVSSIPLFSDKAMLVYTDTNSDSVPRYRSWDGSSWSSEQSAEYVGGDITHLVLEASPSSGEFILGSLDENLDGNFQVYEDGWGSVTEHSRYLNSYERRGFDIAYERNSGEALAVYDAYSSVRYSTWDGSWSSEEYISSSTLGSGSLYWLSLESAPDSDEIVMVTLDSSRDIRAQVWDGSSWVDSEFITNDARATSYQCYDVVYEQQSGNAVVVWSNMNGNAVYYKIWDGSSWSSATSLYSFDDSHRVYWIKMAADPNSDDILVAMSDLDNDVRVATWDGSSWSSTQEIESSSPTYAIRSFDVAFENNSGNGMVVWSNDTAVPRYKTWNGSSWSSELAASNVTNDVRWVKLESDPVSNSIFLVTSDDGGFSAPDINVQEWDGSSWDVPVEVETSSRSDYENFDLIFSNANSEATTPQLTWNLWSAWVASELQNDSISHLENAVNTMTCEGLTAIDEGIYEANNELEGIGGNTTMILMTDGIDNAGAHSLLEQAQRARQQNTVIYTVGFADNESEVDPVLQQVANITGGEYYFAPNSTVLETIFTGIAGKLTNFTADGPQLSIHVPNNYITGLSVAKATYQANSSNATTWNASVNQSSYLPTYPPTGNAEPTINGSGNKTMLDWDLPTMGAGDKWGVWYQLKVKGAGSTPLILPTSVLSYTDINGTTINVTVSHSGGISTSGFGASVDYVSLGGVTIKPASDVTVIDNETTILVSVEYVDGNPAIADAYIYTDLGVLNGDPVFTNMTISGSEVVTFSSTNSGWAHLRAYANNGNNTVIDNSSIFVRPLGQITIS
ncbi:Mg-chelatase subunit ChlD [Methanohalophilus levihalophilus]|uniref:VWA domain-containing protein n=1 Tax=Methanohalophilus levihalophilus TaxID=1431282 RepID=UPI001AE755A2|nr:VWA domain-containing protein [Methanohalophilus levihalophilus]MBP2031022.1 Mg-chelatase subunit ChlD [Methanohalophilus levihalophilus]